MVIQHHNQHFVISNAENFTAQLEVFGKIKKTVKHLFGFIGLLFTVVIAFPFLLFAVWYLTYKTRQMLKEAIKERKQLEKEIADGLFSYEEVMELENKIKTVISKVEVLAYTKIDLKIFNRLLSNLKLFLKEMIQMQKTLHSSYVYNTEDLNMTAEELKEYMDQFKGLEDIWNYESTKEDDEVVFNHKKQLLSA